MTEKLIHIIAKDPHTLKTVDLYYVSIKQAKFFNRHLIEFRVAEL